MSETDIDHLVPFGSKAQKVLQKFIDRLKNELTPILEAEGYTDVRVMIREVKDGENAFSRDGEADVMHSVITRATSCLTGKTYCVSASVANILELDCYQKEALVNRHFQLVKVGLMRWSSGVDSITLHPRHP